MKTGAVILLAALLAGGLAVGAAPDALRHIDVPAAVSSLEEARMTADPQVAPSGASEDTGSVPIPEALAPWVSTSIPVISVDTGGTEVLSRETYVPCTVSAYGVPKAMALSGSAAGIRVRGNSSSYYGDEKMIRTHAVPYRLRFDEKVNMLGLNGGAECRSWVLLTNRKGAPDAVKNDIALRIGRMLLGPDGLYCSDSRLVSLFLNGSFQGVYLLCEQNQVNAHRIKINEPSKGETGVLTGYLAELDEYREEPYFRMDYESAAVKDVNGNSGILHASFYSVKSDTYSREQLDFIAGYIRGAFRILYEACEKGRFLAFDSEYGIAESGSSGARECVEAAIDIGSAVDMYILYELMGDYDAGNSSFFMCVDLSEDSLFPKLTFTAPWDFDLTCSGDPERGLFACTFPSFDELHKYGERSNPWFILLYKQEWFREMVEERWKQIGGSSGIRRLIEEERKAVVSFSEDMDRIGGTASAESLEHLDWIEKRAARLDMLWLK
ncbi:MAG: CotH kinase family protein [Firmicutes bacterium]|nr:CotH kinase family protein [Bacillota bacterium]